MRNIPPQDWPVIWLGIVLNVLAIVYLCHEFYLSWRNTRLEKQEELESR